jgi:membrane protein implicated in regulation of membrane protease activity
MDFREFAGYAAGTAFVLGGAALVLGVVVLVLSSVPVLLLIFPISLGALALFLLIGYVRHRQDRQRRRRP